MDKFIEAVENEIPEEPECEKTAGKKVKKEIEKELLPCPVVFFCG